jgi:hypothetical protein
MADKCIVCDGKGVGVAGRQCEACSGTGIDNPDLRRPPKNP